MQSLNLELDAVSRSVSSQELNKKLRADLQIGSVELNNLREEILRLDDLTEALAKHLSQLKKGRKTPPRGHLVRPVKPMDLKSLRTNRIAEAWAAASIGLLMIGLILIMLFARQYLIVGIGGLLAGFFFFEAAFRGRLNQLVVQLSTFLAVVASIVLVYEFFWTILIISILLAGSYILWENLRELWV